MLIEFKAYGGVGSQIARSFVVLSALNSFGFYQNTSSGQQHVNTDSCTIYRMDFDDKELSGGQHTDYEYLGYVIEQYEKLYMRDLGFLAPMELKLNTNPAHTLKAIRERAYPDEKTFSLSSIYLTGTNADVIRSFLTSAFTSDPNNPDNTAELEISNLDGNYGDLAVNSFINERIVQCNAYEKSGIYNGLQGHNDFMVFYAGSMDGGTANTNIDKDIRSLLKYLRDTLSVDISQNRTFRIYGLRTTPYSKFELTGTPANLKVTKPILDNKYEMAMEVLRRIEDQNQVSQNPSRQLDGVDPLDQEFSYYKLDDSTKYWLDGLCLGSSKDLDVTMEVALKDQQFHPMHLVELSLAQQAMDAIAGRLPNTPGENLYGYNDGGSYGAGDGKATKATLKSFFGHNRIKYDLQFLDPEYGDTFAYDKYINAFLLMLVALRGTVISDFRNSSQSSSKDYIEHLFNVRKHGKAEAARNVNTICPLVADELAKFMEECKFIVDAFVNVTEYSKFGLSDSVVNFEGGLIKYLYDLDFYDRQVQNPKTIGIKRDENEKYVIYNAPTDGAQYAGTLDMHEFNWFFDGKRPIKLKKEFYYNSIEGSDDQERARQVANDLIVRLFEIYLVTDIA